MTPVLASETLRQCDSCGIQEYNITPVSITQTSLLVLVVQTQACIGVWAGTGAIPAHSPAVNARTPPHITAMERSTQRTDAAVPVESCLARSRHRSTSRTAAPQFRPQRRGRSDSPTTAPAVRNARNSFPLPPSHPRAYPSSCGIIRISRALRQDHGSLALTIEKRITKRDRGENHSDRVPRCHQGSGGK
jgi:hypothetical protein